ncbi:hypothetical protein ACHAXS_009150 [Conticribra weissflogii]
MLSSVAKESIKRSPMPPTPSLIQTIMTQSHPAAIKPQIYSSRVHTLIRQFYQQNPHIGESHGLKHVMAVHGHAVRAIDSHREALSKGSSSAPPICDMTAMEIEVAAILHDVDDRKYFPRGDVFDDRANCFSSSSSSSGQPQPNLPNALHITKSAEIPEDSIRTILKMISWVGCSENGNSIPPEIEVTKKYHYLIPRWSDRLEAVGPIGVVRCYQYNREIGAPLWKDDDLYDSPRPSCEEEVWEFATPERFEGYLTGEKSKKGVSPNKKQKRGSGNENIAKNEGVESSMISHYYDKLLHVARPPPEIVRNDYLESIAKESSKELVEVCLRFGRTGIVDEEYILALDKKMSK